MQSTPPVSHLALALVLAAVGAPAHAVAQSPTAPPDTAAPAHTPDVIFVASPPGVVDAMLRVARVTRRDTVYDLGSGDGRIVITAAKRFGARGVGIDVDPELITQSRRNADSAGVSDRVEFLEQDLFEADLRQATVVTLYLFEELNVRLRPRLLTELRPGTRIVSHEFGLGDWQPDSVVRVQKDYSNVYYWVVPARVGGLWKMSLPSHKGVTRRYALQLHQQYQRVSGAAMAGGRTLPLTNARLVGERITFTVRDTVGGRTVAMRFSGRVSGNAMTGTVTTGGSAERHAWRATRVPS